MAEGSAEPLSRKGRSKLKKATKTEETAAKKKLRAQWTRFYRSELR
jgi:hypothetical protein